MTAPDLLPCFRPTCGGRAEYVPAFGVKCTACGLALPCTEAEAIAAWNTRATPAAMTPEVRALVEAAERAEAKAKRLETALKLIELIGYREGKDWAWIASHMRGCATAAIKGDPLELYFRMVPGFPLAALRERCDA